MVPVTPVSLGVMLRSCSSIRPPCGEGKTTLGKEKGAELCTRSPGMAETVPQPWGTGYFSSPLLLPYRLLPQAGTLPRQGSHSCLSQSSAISPRQAEPIFIAPKAKEPNALILMLQVKIPETIFHLKTAEKVGHKLLLQSHKLLRALLGAILRKKGSLIFGGCCK